MRRLNLTELAQQVVHSVDILRGRLNASDYSEIISGMLLLKWVSDQNTPLHVPKPSKWAHIIEDAHRDPGEVLDHALQGLVSSNRELLGDVLTNVDFRRGLGPRELNALISHFDQISLSDEELGIPNAVGRIYDDVIGYLSTDYAKKGAEHFTPRSVVQLMVRLTGPKPGQSVYDPFVGSGGMLIEAKQYVEERFGERARLALFGQELNASTCTIARINLLLHGALDASILYGDTLADPLHMVIDGQRNFFDRILTNPALSANSPEHEIHHRERMRYGWTKKADLLNVQHVLAMLSRDGIGAVISPHGVLFRGGIEAAIRRGIIEDGRLDAVINIGPSFFYAPGVPACILVLRGENGLPQGQQGKILFINAEYEVATERSKNRLEPHHVEKIVSAFRTRQDIEGFSRLVTLDEIAENEFNLDVRRYVETSLTSEPRLDTRAVLFGGVPRKEVLAQGPRFQAFGIDLTDLFQVRNHQYLDFLPEGYKATASRIGILTRPSERELLSRAHQWWERVAHDLARLAGTKKLLPSRAQLMSSFLDELLPARILDQYQVVGAFADWWSGNHESIQILDNLDFSEVINRWGMTQYGSPEQVLAFLENDLCVRVERLVAIERQKLVDVYRSWGDRYATSLLELEEQRESGATRVRSHLRKLGYPWPNVHH